MRCRDLLRLPPVTRSTVGTAVAEIGYLSPDVVYLDVQLGPRSGFEVVEGLRGITKPLIVFTTAAFYDEGWAAGGERPSTSLRPVTSTSAHCVIARRASAMLLTDVAHWNPPVRRPRTVSTTRPSN